MNEEIKIPEEIIDGAEKVIEEAKPVENVMNVITKLDNKQVAVVAGTSVLATIGGFLGIRFLKNKVIDPLVNKVKAKKAAKAVVTTEDQETTENPDEK